LLGLWNCREPVPEVVDLVLVFALHIERHSFSELEKRTPIQGHEPLPIELKNSGQHLALHVVSSRNVLCKQYATHFEVATNTLTINSNPLAKRTMERGTTSHLQPTERSNNTL
jgi:hypothetical protein